MIDFDALTVNNAVLGNVIAKHLLRGPMIASDDLQGILGKVECDGIQPQPDLVT